MPEVLLTRGALGTPGQSIASGANVDTDVMCVGDSTLVVEADMAGAANGDLSVVVQPYESDNATIMPISLPPTQSIGPTLSAGKVYYYAQFDVSALEKVRVRMTNNNAGAQNLTRASWRLQ